MLDRVSLLANESIEIEINNGITAEPIAISPYEVGDIVEQYGIGFKPDDLCGEVMVAGWKLPSGAILGW